MGKALADAFASAREVFQEVDALSQKLSKIMWEGPESDLLLTENAQPAVMAASTAVARLLEKDMGLTIARHARLVAGHSLGEYSALCAAGAFSLPDTARLLKTRGLAMQSAVPLGEGGMTALIGAEIEAAEEVAKEAAAGGGTCVVANDNAPGQVVISGTLDHAGPPPATSPRPRASSTPLPVCRALSLPLDAACRRDGAGPRCRHHPPIGRAGAGKRHRCRSEQSEAVRRLLVEQVTGRVRWRESILALRSLGVDTTMNSATRS